MRRSSDAQPDASAGRPSKGRSGPGRVLRLVFAAPLRLYEWHLGWLLGHRFVRLTHYGRRSGRRYQTVLEVVGRDRLGGELFVMAGFGRTSDWFRNIGANPQEVEIDVAGGRFVADHRLLGEDEAAQVLSGYEHRNRLVAPVVRLMLARLTARPYDGSDAARREVVRLLPVVAFRPRPPA